MIRNIYKHIFKGLHKRYCLFLSAILTKELPNAWDSRVTSTIRIRWNSIRIRSNKRHKRRTETFSELKLTERKSSLLLLTMISFTLSNSSNAISVLIYLNTYGIYFPHFPKYISAFLLIYPHSPQHVHLYLNVCAIY